MVISLKKKEKKLKPKIGQLKFRPVTLFSHLTGRRTVIRIIKKNIILRIKRSRYFKDLLIGLKHQFPLSVQCTFKLQNVYLHYLSTQTKPNFAYPAEILYQPLLLLICYTGIRFTDCTAVLYFTVYFK